MKHRKGVLHRRIFLTNKKARTVNARTSSQPKSKNHIKGLYELSLIHI